MYLLRHPCNSSSFKSLARLKRECELEPIFTSFRLLFKETATEMKQ